MPEGAGVSKRMWGAEETLYTPSGRRLQKWRRTKEGTPSGRMCNVRDYARSYLNTRVIYMIDVPD